MNSNFVANKTGESKTNLYYEQPNPYVNAPSCNVKLLELSRYAKKHNKKLVELTREEVARFSI